MKNFRNYVVAGDWIRLEPPYALVSIPARVASVLKSFRNYVQHTSQMLHQLNPLGLLESMLGEVDHVQSLFPPFPDMDRRACPRNRKMGVASYPFTSDSGAHASTQPRPSAGRRPYAVGPFQNCPCITRTVRKIRPGPGSGPSSPVKTAVTKASAGPAPQDPRERVGRKLLPCYGSVTCSYARSSIATGFPARSNLTARSGE